jgi:hypothetical protein
MMLMVMMSGAAFARPFFQEKDDIDELENAEGVKDEESDEPPYLPPLCRMPESVSLENNSKDDPKREYEKEDRSEYAKAERAPYLRAKYRIRMIMPHGFY